MAATSTREPLLLVAGDTISFTRTLPDYPATDGWSLKYEIRGGAQAIEFTSVASGAAHQVKVEEDVTATWLPGDYTIAGFAINANTGDRHQIYYAAFEIFKDLVAAPGDANLQTHAQRMVKLCEDRLEELAAHVLNDSKVETTEWYRTKREEYLRLRNHYKAEVKNELDAQRAANGLPSRNKITPIFNITGGNTIPFASR